MAATQCIDVGADPDRPLVYLFSDQVDQPTADRAETRTYEPDQLDEADSEPEHEHNVHHYVRTTDRPAAAERRAPQTLSEAASRRLTDLVGPPFMLTWTNLRALGAGADTLLFEPTWGPDLTRPVVERLQVTWRDLVDAGLITPMLIEFDRPFRWWSDVFGADELFVQHFQLDEDDWARLRWDRADVLACTGYAVALNLKTGFVECMERAVRRVADM